MIVIKTRNPLIFPVLTIRLEFQNAIVQLGNRQIVINQFVSFLELSKATKTLGNNTKTAIYYGVGLKTVIMVQGHLLTTLQNNAKKFAKTLKDKKTGSGKPVIKK